MHPTEVLVPTEFIRRHVGAVVSAAQGGSPFYFGTEPLPSGRMLMVLRMNGVTYRTIVDQPSDPACLAIRAGKVDQLMAREILAAWTDCMLNDSARSRVATADPERLHLRVVEGGQK